MTRINTTPAAIRKPDSVLFGELAIAAGMTGNPVAVCFSESAAVVDCELWKYLAQCAGPGRAMHVHSQIDVHKLTKAVGSCPLVVVHAPRLFNTVAWTVQMHGSQTSARPAIFTRMVPNSLEDVPIPILVLRNTPDESSSILRWLMAGCPQRACLPDVQPTNGITLDPALSPVTIPSKLSNGRGPTKLRDCQLLTALLSGACLTNNAEQAPESTDSATCGQREYERVRRLLQSPFVDTSNEPADQLAVEMVNRSNVFLELKCNAEFIYAHPSLCSPGDPIRRQRGSYTHQDLVSRREVADLGNVRCRLIQQIVDGLQNLPDGYERFLRMGLIRRPPSKRDFDRSDPRTLSLMLRPWSQKQVRTHFDALRKAGWITGERESANAAWQYYLPEELNMSSSPFRSLRPANELFSETRPST
jgi:hypothetical protein